MSASLSGSSRAFRVAAAAHAAVCVALWPVPVFGLLHAESSAVVAGVGCLVAAVASARPLRAGAPLASLARAHLAALAVPLALLTVSALWRPNCGYAQGLGLFATLVPPSVLFGLGVAAVVSAFGVRGPRATAAIAILGVAVGGVAADLLLHPQLFTYSHVFGGVLGPIYDEELAVRPGLFAAKAQTLLWATALLFAARWRRGGGPDAARAGGAAVALLGLSYAFAQPLGVVQTEGGIRSVLSARVDLGPVVVHLDPSTPRAARQRAAEEALFRFETLAEALGVRPHGPVDVYLYPDPDTKAALIGSRETSVVPVWLRSPQVHMLEGEVGRALGHELVHVLAREFGTPVLRASPAIGLVEGVAVALEPPDGLPDAARLVRAGMGVPERSGGLPDPAAAVRATMSPGGFWTARAGVAYTANGAFVRWLLEEYGAGPLREAYRTGRFEPAYGRSLDRLTAEWAAWLARQPVDAEAVAVARWLFSRPSLFEVRCPHHVPRAERLARNGAEAWEAGAASRAGALFDAAVARDPIRLDALDGRLATHLALTGAVPDDALGRARALADTLRDAASLGHLADVLRLAGRDAEAEATYRAAGDSLAPVDAAGRLLLDLRRQLAPASLAELVGTPPDSVTGRLEQRAPVHAALRHAAADRPAEAWHVARAWCAAPAPGEAGRVLRLIQANLAHRAGAFVTARRLYAGLADAFEAEGPRSYAPLVRDAQRRLDWRRRLGPGAPGIFAVPSSVPDALAPCPPGPRLLDGGRVRRPG